jgi:hypothetical protein
MKPNWFVLNFVVGMEKGQVDKQKKKKKKIRI